MCVCMCVHACVYACACACACVFVCVYVCVYLRQHPDSNAVVYTVGLAFGVDENESCEGEPLALSRSKAEDKQAHSPRSED